MLFHHKRKEPSFEDEKGQDLGGGSWRRRRTGAEQVKGVSDEASEGGWKKPPGGLPGSGISP